MTVTLETTLVPRWDLERAFGLKSLEDPKFTEVLDALEKDADLFHVTYKGKLAQQLTAAILEYDRLSERLTDMEGFVGAIESVNMKDDSVNKLASAANARTAHISGSFLYFFDLELMDLDESVIEKTLKENETELSRFAPYFQKLQRLKPHVLSPEVERALTLREPYSGGSTVVTAYRKEMTEAVYKWVHPETGKEEDISESRLLDMFYDANWKVRRAAGKLLNSGLASNGITKFSALSLNMAAGSRTIENKERHFDNIRSFRNLNNDVEDDVVDALISAAQSKGLELNKRFYTLKKNILLKNTDAQDFHFSDRNAPLGLDCDANRIYQWADCVRIVSESYREFSDVFADYFEQMVAEKRIDAFVDDQKQGGAFCILGTKTSGTLQMINYLGKMEDVITVAHESGHAVHGVLSQVQPNVLKDPSMAIAETASIFGEMLVFKKALRGLTSPKERLEKLMGKLGGIMNTVIRQLSFDHFEALVHERRKDGLLSIQEISDFWKQATTAYYGNEGEVFDSLANIENIWAYVHHFHIAPFYVYSYAFADLVVGSLYKVYTEKSVDNFEQKFLDFLRAGGSQTATELLKPFNLDASSKQFWIDALEGYVQPLLEEAEGLARELGFE